MFIRKILGSVRRRLRSAVCLVRIERRYRSHKKNIILFGVPFHSNMGDQAQTYCILKWFGKNYPEHYIHPLSLPDCSERLYQSLRKLIGSEDKIFFHSGYHMTDLYDERKVYCRVLELFGDYEIVVFPQTIHFLSKDNEHKTAEVFNRHGRVKLMCRDEKSFETGLVLFNECSCFLRPDVVTSLIGTISYENARNGVLFCMRNDKEALYSQAEINGLIGKLTPNTKVDLTDTTIEISHQDISVKRGAVLYGIFDEYSRYKVIVTDRYHGTIFSLISGTPVVVLSSTDHKLSSGVDWFPDSFSQHVSFASNLNEANERINYFLENYPTTTLPPYFREKYFDALKLELGIDPDASPRREE